MCAKVRVSGIFYTVGYSKKLTDTITADDELINVQVSYSYNEKEDVMEISVGYPVINDSYYKNICRFQFCSTGSRRLL